MSGGTARRGVPPITPLLSASIAAMIAGFASPASAAGPIQLQQLELAKGEWQVEYWGLSRRGAKDEHSLEIMTGLSNHLALGVEVDTLWSARKPALDGIAPTIVYRFSSPSAAIGIGVLGQVEVGADLHLDSAEAGLILEHRSRDWSGHANIVLRRSSEGQRPTTGVNYCWSLGRTIAADVSIGVEGSGGLAHSGGSGSSASWRGHFVGPALSIERDYRGRSVEFGVAYLRRIDGPRPSDAVRLISELRF